MLPVILIIPRIEISIPNPETVINAAILIPPTNSNLSVNFHHKIISKNY